MHLGKMGLMLLVPALALSSCTTSMTAEQAMAHYGTLDPVAIRAMQDAEIQGIVAQSQRSNAQMQQNLQNGFQMIQRGQTAADTIYRGQTGWQDLPQYTYQRPDSVWVHCTRLSDSVVSCRKL